MDTGLFRFVPKDEPKTPPRPSTPLSTFPLGNTRQSKTAKPCLVNQTKPSAFRHERRWCEASTTHSHACEQTSRARLRRHFPNLMRYPSYAQRTSTTLPSCGKLQFLKTQKQGEATPRFVHARTTAATTSTGRFTTTRLINPPCHRRRTRTQLTPESNTTDSHHAPERTTTPTGFIFLSSASYAHRSLPNTGLMSSFAHRQPPGVSTPFRRIELDLRLLYCLSLTSLLLS
jgi:hypothetical protein